jgi:cell division cycle 20, cofactor of APC complex
MVHSYPSLDRIAEVRDAHDQRVLHAVLGPSGDVVCTGAGDENLKFWRIWDAPVAETKGKKIGEGKEARTDTGVLAIR